MADVIETDVMVEDDRPSGSAPWHFWAIATVGLLWNSFGALDYTMTQLRNPAWIGQIDAATLSKIDSAPLWATSCWALGVWGSFIGALLLLMRRASAITAFAISFVAAVISFAWQWLSGLVATPVLPAVILSAVAFFWWYARSLRDGGVLR